MPVAVDDIEEADAAKLYPLAVPVKLKGGAEGVINLKYREPTTERTAGANNALILSRMIAEWDVVDREGKPVAPDYAYFSQRPFTYLEKLLEAITEDFNPSKKGV
jgi:hypothetical protein